VSSSSKTKSKTKKKKPGFIDNSNIVNCSHLGLGIAFVCSVISFSKRCFLQYFIVAGWNTLRKELKGVGQLKGRHIINKISNVLVQQSVLTKCDSLF